PESVIPGETGLLVSPGDTSGLSQALEQLIRDPELRARYGRAGRARIEQHFRIEQTVAPLLQLFERISVGPGRLRNLDLQSVRAIELDYAERESAPKAFEAANTGSMPMFQSGTIAYLIDRWPDEDLPLIERELQELKRRNLSIVPFVCALILQELADVTVSATIEPSPELPRNWIEGALRRCRGGRLSDRKLLRERSSSFLFDKVAFHSGSRKAIGLLGKKIGIDLTKG